jgi:AcrR family transcriptional regulator
MARTPTLRTSNQSASKGDRTRDAIVDTIVDLVNAQPIDRIRVADICAPSQLAVGAFYFHFRSKDDALDQIATAVVGEVYDAALAVPHSTDLFSEVVGILSEFYRCVLEQRARVKAFMIIINARRHPNVRTSWMNRRALLVDRVAARITETRGDGAGSGFASSTVTAHFLIGALERFYDDVFLLAIDDILPAEAANFDVFVRQQAQTWVQVMNGGRGPIQKTE